MTMTTQQPLATTPTSSSSTPLTLSRSLNSMTVSSSSACAMTTFRVERNQLIDAPTAAFTDILRFKV
jgi:hypothetical protein